MGWAYEEPPAGGERMTARCCSEKKTHVFHYAVFLIVGIFSFTITVSADEALTPNKTPELKHVEAEDKHAASLNPLDYDTYVIGDHDPGSPQSLPFIADSNFTFVAILIAVFVIVSVICCICMRRWESSKIPNKNRRNNKRNNPFKPKAGNYRYRPYIIPHNVSLFSWNDGGESANLNGDRGGESYNHGGNHHHSGGSDGGGGCDSGGGDGGGGCDSGGGYDGGGCDSGGGDGGGGCDSGGCDSGGGGGGGCD